MRLQTENLNILGNHRDELIQNMNIRNNIFETFIIRKAEQDLAHTIKKLCEEIKFIKI